MQWSKNDNKRVTTKQQTENIITSWELSDLSRENYVAYNYCIMEEWQWIYQNLVLL